MSYRRPATYRSQTNVVCLFGLMCFCALWPRIVKANQAPQPTPEVQGLLAQGQQAAQAGKLVEALAFYQQAVSTALQSGDGAGATEALPRLCDVCENIGQSARVEASLKQAFIWFCAVTDRKQMVSTLRYIGRTYFRIDEPEKALICWQKALQYTPHDDPSNVAWLSYYIGCAYSDLGESLQARNSFEQAQGVAQTNGDKETEAVALVGIGRVSLDLAQPTQAFAAVEKARSWLEHMTDQGALAVALNDIGQVYFKLGNTDVALIHWKRALHLFRTFNNVKGAAVVQINIGNAYSQTDKNQALNTYKELLTTAEKISDRSLQAKALTNIGSIYADMALFDDALPKWKDALSLLMAIGDTKGEAIVRDNMGRIYSRMEKWDDAAAQYKIATQLAHDNDHITEINILSDYAALEAQRQNFGSAISYYNNALTQIERLRTGLGGYTDAKSRYLQSQLPVYYAAMNVALSSHDSEQAFCLAQKTKARNLLDLMAFGPVDLTHDLTDEEYNEVQHLRQRADFLNQQMVKEGVENAIGAKKRYAVRQQELKQTEDSLQEITDRLYTKYPALARKRAAKTAVLADMAQLLPIDTALLEYVVTSSHEVTLFVVRRDGGTPAVQAFPLPLEYGSLAKETAVFHDACADPKDSNRYVEYGQSLYRKLIAPAKNTLQGITRLVICPDQALWDVPFAALLDGKTFLADEFEIDYAYSATGLQAARLLHQSRKQAQPPGTLLVVANPDFGDMSRFEGPKFGDPDGIPGQRPLDMPSRPFAVPTRPFDMPSRPLDMPSRPLDMPSRTLGMFTRGQQIAPLAGTQAEADELKMLFPDATIYTGSAAQEAKVKQEAGNYRYLHFGTHGFFNNTQPMLSSIVLAQPERGSKDDGLLTARELSELNLNAELVVLSACNTARGEERSGEGVIGLSWALLVAGAPTQVVSQWSVDDAATATLMKSFYTILLNAPGQGKGAALREASRALRNDPNPKYRHPYYWAPFLLLGDWQ